MTRRTVYAVARAAAWVLCFVAFATAVSPRAGRAQSLWFDRLPPSPTIGTSAPVTVGMVGAYGLREDCTPQADFDGCSYTAYDFSLDLGSYTLRVNGVDRTASTPVVAGPWRCEPRGVTGIAYDCWQESFASGTLSFGAGGAVTLDASVHRVADSHPLSAHYSFNTHGAGPAVTLVSPQLYHDPARCGQVREAVYFASGR